MAYDGVAVAAAVKELNDRLLMGSVSKVAQPEKDELLLTLKCSRQQIRLCISANASNPMIYLREDNPLSPVTAPNFCMALRKHIGGGRIKRIFQPCQAFAPEEGTAGAEDDRGLERIVVFVIEHLDEMGDLSEKYLIAELMGKYSNIILTRQDLTIIDSIRHVSGMMSSVREVLPGRRYFIPDASDKLNPLSMYNDPETFGIAVRSNPVLPMYKKLYMTFTGFSPKLSEELLFRSGTDPDITNDSLTQDQEKKLFNEFSSLVESIVQGRFEPCIIYEGEAILDLSGIRLSSLEGGDFNTVCYDSMSEVVRLFYEKRDRQNRIRAKSEDIRRTLKTLTERASRKLEILEKQLSDTEKREKYRLYGEMINTYGYSLNGGEDHLICENYYDGGKQIRIPLDPQLSASENAKKYFDRYGKLKRTREAVEIQAAECRDQLYHLESIAGSLSLCETESDLNELCREMHESGYYGRKDMSEAGKAGAKGVQGRNRFGKDSAGKSDPKASGGRGNAGRAGKTTGKKERREERSAPLHFVSSDGIDIYVGRNNYQNEELTFGTADANDWWFHAKNMPGSHVIVKTGSRELPDKTCLEAAALAAYYSKAGMLQENESLRSGHAEERSGRTKGSSAKIEVDYVRRKELKRVPKAAPGFVIYHTNYSIMIEPRGEIC